MTPVDHLIEQYWAGKATASEIEQLYRHVHTLRPEASFDDFELFLDRVTTEQADIAMTDAQARHLLNGIKQKANIPVQEFKEKKKFGKMALAAAACFLIAGFIGLSWLLQRSNIYQSESKQFAQVSDTRRQVSKYIINNGSTVLDTTLPDHSKISVFPRSSVAFTNNFEPHARRVSMQGKVRFHVAKDKTRPFRVWAGGLVTTAIGTVFEVNTLNRNQTDIKLIEGKISVKRAAAHHADSVILLAGQNLVYLVGEDRIKPVDNLNNRPVKDPGSELVFNDLPLSLVFKQLEMEYGIVIEYEAPSPEVRFSASFRKPIGPDKIISEIVKQNKLTMQHSNGVYTIK